MVLKFILASIKSFSHLCFIGFIFLLWLVVSCFSVIFYLCFCSISSSDFLSSVHAVYHAALTQPVSKINLIVVWLLCCWCKKIHLAITVRALEVVPLTFSCWKQSQDTSVELSPGCLLRGKSCFHLRTELSERYRGTSNLASPFLLIHAHWITKGDTLAVDEPKKCGVIQSEVRGSSALVLSRPC